MAEKSKQKDYNHTYSIGDVTISVKNINEKEKELYNAITCFIMAFKSGDEIHKLAHILDLASAENVGDQIREIHGLNFTIRTRERITVQQSLFLEGLLHVADSVYLSGNTDKASTLMNFVVQKLKEDLMKGGVTQKRLSE